MHKIIEIIKYIIIGIVQGISEIFPISSSGHLTIFYFLFDINENDRLNLTLFLHLASCIALLIFYKKTILNIIKSSFYFLFKKDKSYKEGFNLLLYLCIATIPSVIIGFFIKPLIENSFNNLLTVAIGFLITSIILLISKKIKGNNIKYTFKNTLITGIFQSFALLPGISRSGTTILGSKIAKLDDKNGKELTFLLLIPITLGSTILSFFDVSFSKINHIYLYIISFIISFIFTFMSLKLFVNKYKIKHNTYFSSYLIALSSIILYFLYFFK